MNILFDINHPADVHQFKVIIKILKKKHKVIVVARDKDVTFKLLNELNIKFIPRKGSNGLIRKALNSLKIELMLLQIGIKNKIDLFIGSSGNIYVAHVAWILRKKSLLFDDTEHAKLQKMFSFPFASKIIVPSCYNKQFSKQMKKKVVYYAGFKETAYLSPKYFKPNKTGLKLKKGKNILVRLVSWNASHDGGHGGLKNVNKILSTLSKLGNLHITSELKIPEKFKQYKISIPTSRLHDLLASVDLVVSEGGSVAAESAFLGTPTIYVNDLKMGYTDDLKKRKLLFQTTDENKILSLSKKLVLETKSTFKKKSIKLFKEQEDVNKFMISLIENGQ